MFEKFSEKYFSGVFVSLVFVDFFGYFAAVVSSDSEHTVSAMPSSSKLKPRIIGKVVNCICEQNVDIPPLTQVCCQSVRCCKSDM